MQHLGVNFGGILRFEVGIFICFFLFFFRWKNMGWFLKVQWQHFHPQEAYAMCSLRITCNTIISPS